MSSIILPGNDNPKDDTDQQVEELTYQATEADEEKYFLMQQLHMQPSEAENLKPDYRKWLCARVIYDMKMRHEMMQQQRLMQRIGPDLAGGSNMNLVK